ncbi:MAG: hypothetical protein CL927_12305 [Deltaproteobacteria bacterium]|nr:hypothetical protein [Deltaproteobacteria bacterium]HCH61272.1 hypothetical protein [Deltaproteobacteria bacterium]
MSRFSARLLLFAAAAVGVIGCGSEPTMSGKVSDVWNTPIAGATVTIEGVKELATTGADGSFNLPVLTGKKRFKAGAEGFVHVQETIVFPEGAGDGVEKPDVKLTLYPAPESTGFHLVNTQSYSKLDGQAIDTTGTELHAYTGIENPGEVKVGVKPRHRVVYRVEHEPHEIAQMGLELHRLEFVAESLVPGPEGEESVKINRFIAKEAVEFDLKQLASDDCYLIVTRAGLEPGYYAFHSEGLLTSNDVDVLDKTPEKLRKAYPFQVK